MNRPITTTHTLFSRLIDIGAFILNALAVLGLALVVAKGPSVTMWMQ